VPAADLRALVPEPLAIDEFGGSAWVGVIPFWMSGVTLRRCPAVPGLSRFPELNVRTYVRLADRPGVWFFSLDAANQLAVWVARWLFQLPYVYARMRVRRTGDRVDYDSRRRDGTAFAVDYRALGDPARAMPGTVEHWLTERYCLYARSGAGALHRAEVHHAPWSLQPAAAHVRRNDLLGVLGIAVTGPAPQQHYARRLDVVVWSPERVEA